MKLFLNNHLLSALAIATVFGCSAGDQSNLASSQQALRATGSGPASLSTLAVSKKSAKKLTGLKTASVREIMSPDEEAGQIFLALLDGSEPQGFVAHVQSKLLELPWQDSHAGIAVAAADLARAEGDAERAFDLYVFAFDKLIEFDPSHTAYPAHLAYVVSRIDDALKTSDDHFNDVHVARLQAWRAAADVLDAAGPPVAVQDIAYNPSATEAMSSREAEFTGQTNLRAWMPQLLLGYVARETGDIEGSQALLESAIVGAQALGIATTHMQTELADTLSQLGDQAGANQLVTAALNDAFSRVANSVDPQQAVLNMSAVRRANIAASETTTAMLTQTIATTDPTSSLGMVARLYAVALNVFVAEDITSYANQPTHAWWSAVDAYLHAFPTELRLPIHFYLSTLGQLDGDQRARNLVYVTLFHKAAQRTVALDELDGGDVQGAETLVDDIVVTLETMLSQFGAEADDHEQSRPTAVVNLVSIAKEAAARFDMDAAFQAGVLATWTL